jgi:hypothetical protein
MDGPGPGCRRSVKLADVAACFHPLIARAADQMHIGLSPGVGLAQSGQVYRVLLAALTQPDRDGFPK